MLHLRFYGYLALHGSSVLLATYLFVCEDANIPPLSVCHSVLQLSRLSQWCWINDASGLLPYCFVYLFFWLLFHNGEMENGGRKWRCQVPVFTEGEMVVTASPWHKSLFVFSYLPLLLTLSHSSSCFLSLSHPSEC